MKCKSDFVTNSSSTSFVGWGITFDKSELRQKLKGSNLLVFGDNGYADADWDEDDRDIAWCDTVEKICNNCTIIRFDTSDDESYVQLAAHPTQINDNETLIQFKQRIVDDLKNAGIEETVSSIEWISECRMDG